ncbi:glucuronyl hydrolase [Mycena floridula]|nr:glucuronyl hydrolase [Mycena floridula]
MRTSVTSLIAKSFLASLLMIRSRTDKCDIPSELFSSAIPTKVLAAANLSLSNPTQYPQYTSDTGNWLLFPTDTWTSGFLPATLYALHARKKLCGATEKNGLCIANWKKLARETSAGLVPLETNPEARQNIQHDVGFISFPFAEELAINPKNPNISAVAAINNFATALAERFNPTVGCTRSWDTEDPTDFQVIVDNMMNLEVLFLSAHLTGNKTLIEMAICHADTTMRNHIRPDGSMWHVIEYNATTGAVTRKRTEQGYSDFSAWSRGQAWGVYGFANMYKRTHKRNYLKTARRLANFFLDNIPANGVIPWDFNAPEEDRPADSSAATIIANGLLMLSQHETDHHLAKKWTNAAIDILDKVTKQAWNPSWQSLLSNGTVDSPHNNSLTGTVYGDYYYVRAGNELLRMGLAQCS